ncbi:MAG: hypothetical protein HY052_02255 [Proteobacteria bacterium]|nr:hypothetical protein [Pseudomonadota bacterium]
MKIRQILMAAVIVVAASSAAMAQTPAAPATPPPFEAQKAMIIKNLSDGIADAQKKLSCVKEASDAKAVQACFGVPAQAAPPAAAPATKK